MSKASEWVRLNGEHYKKLGDMTEELQNHKPEKFFGKDKGDRYGSKPTAIVDDNGWLRADFVFLDPEEALALAAWILKNFGEDE